MKLDRFAKRNLELLQNSRTGKKSGTLLWILDATKTAMGGRLLKQWLSRPLLSKDEIEQRQGIVQNLMDNFFERNNLQDELTNVYDLERLAGKIAFGSANGRDLIQLKTSLSHVPPIRYLLSQLNTDGIYNDLLAELDPVGEVADLIEQAIVDDPPISVTDGNLIREGYNDELDQYVDAMKNGKQWLADLEEQEREKTGIHNLKIGFNKVFGYYIEVSKGNANKVPQDRYQRKQTLVNAERFITPELKEKESLILGSESKAYDLQYKLFVDVREQIKDQIKRIQKLAHALAKLDVLQGFAVVSENHQFVKPELTTHGHSLEIKDGWHPVVEEVMGRQSYVPNDIKMDDDQTILLITGPNMSGKSTYMRQLALTVIMAQIGCFVPATQARMPIFDQIFTRIGAADDLISGESTFMVEMKEANEALENASENSLILFDEIGRGTATYDGMALAQAIIEFIHDHVHAKTLFSTHYHELTVLDKKLKHLTNVHVGAVEKNGELIFLHKMQPGPADKSYGIHVAKLAGMPGSLLQRADVILKRLENDSKKVTHHKEIDEGPQVTSVIKEDESPTSQVDEQLSLFQPETVKLDSQENELLEDIKIDGRIVANDNNVAPFMIYPGFVSATKLDLTLRNCVNSVDIEDTTNTHWGIGPFISGPSYDFTGTVNITLDGCVNEGVITGGQVGWVIANSSKIDTIDAITITDCKNSAGGSVTGYLSAGDICFSGDAADYSNVTADESFVDMVSIDSIDMGSSSASYNKTTRELTISMDPSVADQIASVEVVGRYFLKGYDADGTEIGHKTESIVLFEKTESFSDPLTLKALNAVDSDYQGITGTPNTGDVVTINGTPYIYIGNTYEGAAHTCANTTTHTCGPSGALMIMCYDAADERIGMIPVQL